MATDRQRALVWEGIYDAERLLRYYGYLAERLETLDTRLTWANLILSSGAFGVLVTPLPDSIAAVASVSIAGISVWLVIQRYSRKSVYSAELRRAFADLKIDWERLWSKIDVLDSEHIQEEYSQLQRRAIALTERAPVELRIDEDLLKRSEDEATAFLTAAATREQLAATT